MTFEGSSPRKAIAAGTALATAALMSFTLQAHAAAPDTDRDGIPNRWERAHGMNPFKAWDARADFDKDRLTNLREYRLGSQLRDEDTDNDGHDDGDEVRDGSGSTDLDDDDTDNDGTEDGDEDVDDDDVDNEDEDDALEPCQGDDDDRDDDDVSDEDENELGGSVRDADSDDDGVMDGDEDSDEDGESDEDEDDSLEDSCDDDSDDDGESDEDESDLLGTIDSFDGSTLVITSLAGYTISGQVNEDTEVEFEDHGDDSDEDDNDNDNDEGDDDEGDGNEGDGDDREATTADLQPGVSVAELEFDDETGAIAEVEIYLTTP